MPSVLPQISAPVNFVFPLARLHRGGGRGNLPRQRHHHRDRVLGGRDAVAGRTVHHDDAAPRRRFEVDVVDADAGATDHLEPRGGVDDLARDPWSKLRIINAS